MTSVKHVRLKKTEDTGPLFNKDGTVAVDPVKCPRLYAALERSRVQYREKWERVLELRRQGLDESAERLTKKLLGVKSKKPPMSAEKKAELADWKREHKDEIKARKQQARDVRRRTLALLKTGRRRK
jgi:hypothetical protein